MNPNSYEITVLEKMFHYYYTSNMATHFHTNSRILFTIFTIIFIDNKKCGEIMIFYTDKYYSVSLKVMLDHLEQFTNKKEWANLIFLITLKWRRKKKLPQISYKPFLLDSLILFFLSLLRV